MAITALDPVIIVLRMNFNEAIRLYLLKTCKPVYPMAYLESEKEKQAKCIVIGDRRTNKHVAMKEF